MTKISDAKPIGLPLLKLDEGDKPFFVRPLSSIFRIRGTREWLDVINLETGQEQRIAVHTVLGNAFRGNYVDDAFVGRDFKIKAIKPQDGKAYYTYYLTEIKLSEENEQKLNRLIESKKQESTSNIMNEHIDEDKLLAQSFRDDYRKYLRSRRWKKIRDRVWERDGRRCRRCGGYAIAVHHRSYADEVMLGRDDEKLASICEGCHEVIHVDSSGRRRALEDQEIDRLLLEKDESTNFPLPVVDLRKTSSREHPVEWDRMSAVQRVAWNREYERLWIIAKLRRRNDPKVTDLNRKRLHSFGMDDHAIDLAVSVRLHDRTTRGRKRGE